MAEYLAPGVYVEEVSFRAPSIEGVGTSTAAFVGPTLTGPVGQTPELLTSFGDFQNIYGGYDNLVLTTTNGDTTFPNYMALSVKGFFDNGGSELYVSRVYVAPADANAGVASSGTAGDNNVVINSRFPGAFGKQTVTVALKAAKTQNVGSLPPGTLLATIPAGTGAIAAVDTKALAADTSVKVTPAVTGTAPKIVMIGSEIMSVTAVSGDGLTLTVTRAQHGTSAADHDSGTPVFAPAASVGANIAAADTTVTLSQAIAGKPGSLQIEAEIVTVTAWDSTGLKPTITRAAQGTTAAAHSKDGPIFAPSSPTLYTNGSGGDFKSGSNSLPATLPGDLYNLTMQVTATGASGSPQVFDGLGFGSAHPNYIGTVLGATPPRHIDALENQVAFQIGKNLTATTLLQAIFGQTGSLLTNAPATFTLSSGKDGLEPTSTDYDAALALLTALEDVAIVAAPGAGAFDASQNIINSLITHVSQQRAYRIAILETPPNQIASDEETVRAQVDSSYAALYVPWVIVPNPLARAGSAIPSEIAVPPSGYMAGIYARNDVQHSVSKAPANEVVLGASRFERNITFNEQQLLNPLGINCLRYFPNRGYRVWGARTVSSDSEFMYVNVRRYLIYLEHSIDNSTQWAVFENNGPALWTRVKESVDSFLFNEWKEGNLLGDSAAQAYFVRCDRTTMTQNDLDNGRMICLIGVALLKPAEFVIFRIGQKTADTQS